MILKVNNTISFLKNLWLEVFLNKTDKVTDITENSVLSGVAFGNAKVAQKAIKDIAIVEAQIFPETASGDYLDRAAALFGVSARFGALGSSTYVRVYAEPGTYYESGVNTFVSKDGVRFNIEESVLVGESGYAYVKVRSEAIGAFTNVDANSILTVTPIPNGHYECTNEYYAVGGRDHESDDIFRRRILNSQNMRATATIEKITQVLQNIDNRILKVVYVGVMEDSFIHIQVATQNGQTLSPMELDSILSQAAPYFGLGDMAVLGNLVGVKLENVRWYEVGGEKGIDFRCELVAGADVAIVRRNIQVALTKHLDWRYWDATKKIEWDDLLEIVKSADGVKYVASDNFNPSSDATVPQYMLPRVKRFVMRDLSGAVMFDELNEFSPLFYPAS